MELSYNGAKVLVLDITGQQMKSLIPGTVTSFGITDQWGPIDFHTLHSTASASSCLPELDSKVLLLWVWHT